MRRVHPTVTGDEVEAFASSGDNLLTCAQEFAEIASSSAPEVAADGSLEESDEEDSPELTYREVMGHLRKVMSHMAITGDGEGELWRYMVAVEKHYHQQAYTSATTQTKITKFFH